MPKYSKKKTYQQNVPYKKNLNRNALDNPDIIQSIIDKAEIKSTDIVLELDPCGGNLTVKLLESASKVIAYEVDPKLFAELRKRVTGTPMEEKLQLLNCNVVQSDLPFFDLCIGNVPFQIDYKMLVKLLLHRPLFRCAILLFHKEFADKLVAKPGDANYSRLSASIQLYASVQMLMNVKKNNFKPPAKVDSCVLKIEPKNPPPDFKYEEWDGLTRKLFHRKEKKLSVLFKEATVLTEMNNTYTKHCRTNNIPIPDNFNINEKVDQILTSNEISEMCPRTMDTDDFIKVYTALKNEGIFFYWYL
ncbi:probable dimethyladenosine transferase [Trichogramma pretiosum]|uniref:probable dimethyladenosine transferase n=1 Tax=Trichogramma pretiosum TaxID=7493 RepID=UPI0006C9AE40|nr:probable dimethyladenosine transferase [Trichogramma pretiosum]